MATRIALSEAEIFAAIEAARTRTGDDEARTLNELADAANISPHTMRKALKSFQAQGRLQVHRVYRTALDGRASCIAGYTITAAS